MSSDWWSYRVKEWQSRVFGERHADITPKIYAMRLLEEALELAQAEGVTRSDVHAIVRQVYQRPAHEDPVKEFAGVLICAAGYASVSGTDLNQVFNEEYARINRPEVIERIRHRNLHGDKIGFNKFPSPRRNPDGAPCGECHIQQGETCDICGASWATAKATPEKSPEKILDKPPSPIEDY